MKLGVRGHVGSIAAGVVVATLAAGLVVTGLGSAGASSTQVQLTPGTAWFASPSTGRVSMIDGPTATRVEVLTAAAPGDDLAMVQAGDNGFVVDRTTATMRRVDSSNFTIGPAVSVGTSGDAAMQVMAGDKALWVISQQGTVVQQYDPQLGAAVGGPLTFNGTAGSSTVTPDGTLWVLDSASGRMRSYRDDRVRTDRTLEVSAGSALVAVGAAPVVVDVQANALHVLNASDGSVRRTSCLDIPPGDNPELAGSSSAGTSLVVGVLPNIGTAQIADITADRCRPVTVGAPTSSPRFGAPVVHGARIFVPDQVDGTVVVIEPHTAGDEIVKRINLGLANRRFRLFDHHSYLWFDDPSSDTAGVIRDDLTASIVAKTQGDGQPTQPPDGPTDKPPEDAQHISCTASPNLAQVGQAVQLDASLAPVSANAPTWAWTMVNATPPTAAGPQAHATWTVPGKQTINLSASVQTSNGTPTTLTASCSVMIVDVAVATTTTTTTPPTSAPAVTAPPPPTTTTVAPPPSAAPTTTAPVPSSSAVPPPVVPPPVVPPAGGAATTTTAAPPPPTEPATTTTQPAATTTTAPPVAPMTDFSWSPASPKVGEVVTFTDATTGAHDATNWTFDQGTPPTASGSTPPQVTWSTPGTYMVTLTSVNQGAATSVQKQITVVTNTVVTPSVGTLDLNSAKQALTNAGLVPGTVTTLNRLNTAGSVIATNPPAGSALAPGTTVDLTVSSGLGELSTTAGTGPTTTPTFGGDGGPASAASLYYPTQVLVDKFGNIYIADNKNQRVRKITTDGIINTIAGNGTAGFSGDNGPATGAMMRRPRAMAIDGAGNLYIADLDNLRVRRVDTNGIITTIVGGPPGGVPVSSALWTTRVAATSLSINQPSGLAIDPGTGELILSIRGSCSLLRIDLATGMAGLAAGTGACGAEGADGAAVNATTLGDTLGIAFDSAGKLYITEPNSAKIRVVDNGVVTTVAGTGVQGFNGDGMAGTSTLLKNPDNIAISGSFIVFTDWGNNRVRQIMPDGTIHTIAGDGTGGYTGDGAAANTGELNLNGSGESSGVAIAPDGSVYVADPGNNCIRKII